MIQLTVCATYAMKVARRVGVRSHGICEEFVYEDPMNQNGGKIIQEMAEDVEERPFSLICSHLLSFVSKNPLESVDLTWS